MDEKCCRRFSEAGNAMHVFNNRWKPLPVIHINILISWSLSERQWKIKGSDNWRKVYVWQQNTSIGNCPAGLRRYILMAHRNPQTLHGVPNLQSLEIGLLPNEEIPLTKVNERSKAWKMLTKEVKISSNMAKVWDQNNQSLPFMTK